MDPIHIVYMSLFLILETLPLHLLFVLFLVLYLYQYYTHSNKRYSYTLIIMLYYYVVFIELSLKSKNNCWENLNDLVTWQEGFLFSFRNFFFLFTINFISQESDGLDSCSLCPCCLCVSVLINSEWFGMNR